MPAAIASDPASPAPRRITNPKGNPFLALAPRCGARTRAGGPCQAPAMRGKLRCRRHGGCSTGPRSDAGLARLRVAHTTHGKFGAEARADTRWTITFLRRGRVGNAAARAFAQLPAEFQARLLAMPPELAVPPRPTAGLTVAQDRALRVAETAALAPWRAAIAAVRGQRAKNPEERPHEPDGRVGGMSAAQNLQEEPHVPVGAACDVTSAAGGPAEARPALMPGEAGAADLEEKPHEPVAGAAGLGVAANSVEEPHEPVAPPAGMTRAERKRWKWEQRKARKLAGACVPQGRGIASLRSQ